MSAAPGQSPDDPSDLDGLLRKAIGLFRDRFGRAPRFAAAAPGRVNLIGEHTDYNQGFVLPIAIDRHTVIVAAPSQGSCSTLVAADLDQAFTADLTGPLSPVPRSPANYLLGVADQFASRGHRLPNLDAVVVSSIPIGAGLSSSAAVEVAFATLLEQAIGITLDPMEKILLCQQAEHRFPGTPCGIMDMFIITRAQAGHALLIDCRDNSARAVALPPASRAALLVFDTQVKHDLAQGAYANRRAACTSAAHKLGIPSLRHATPAMLKGPALTSIEHRRALHVVAENARTVLAATELASGRIEAFGELVFASHDSLRDLFEVSCRELDVLVDAARSLRGAGGVFGARMTGGGFGGCAIVLCEPGMIQTTSMRLIESFRAAFGRDCPWFATGAAAAACPLTLPAP